MKGDEKMIDKKTWGLFKPWLIKFNGNTKNSAESYGTYINNCLDLNVNIFDADGNVRKDLEAFFGKQIFLQLFVKVDKDWRQKEGRLKHYGYDLN